MIYTPTKNFRLKKQYKTMIARVLDKHERGALKRALIQAQLASEVLPPKEKGPRRNDRGAE